MEATTTSFWHPKTFLNSVGPLLDSAPLESGGCSVAQSTHEERVCYYYILKLFPFSLKGDAKIWFNSLAPSCVRSPEDMIYYLSAKYLPAHKKQAALWEIFNFVQIEEESLPQAWEASPIT